MPNRPYDVGHLRTLPLLDAVFTAIEHNDEWQTGPGNVISMPEAFAHVTTEAFNGAVQKVDSMRSAALKLGQAAMLREIAYDQARRAIEELHPGFGARSYLSALDKYRRDQARVRQ